MRNTHFSEQMSILLQHQTLVGKTINFGGYFILLRHSHFNIDHFVNGPSKPQESEMMAFTEEDVSQ